MSEQYIRVLGSQEYVTVEKQTGKIISKAVQAPAPSVVNYISVKQASFTITEAMLIPGLNVIGVNYGGPVTIVLPNEEIPAEKLIYVKDESGDANSNPITIVTS